MLLHVLVCPSHTRTPYPSFQELLSNEVLRTHSDLSSRTQQQQEEIVSDDDSSLGYRFCRSVWELHSKIFHGYGLWLKHVELNHARTANASAVLATSNWDSPEAINGLLIELAMYFLVSRIHRFISYVSIHVRYIHIRSSPVPITYLQLWSEASSLRHCPEALWFFFHAMSMSPAAEDLWGANTAALTAVTGVRERRIVMRNLMQVMNWMAFWTTAYASTSIIIHGRNQSSCYAQADIANLQYQFQHLPQSASIDQSFEVLGFIRDKVPGPASFPSVSGSSLAQPLPGDAALLEDLVAMGDGGVFMDRVVTPVFVVISYEVGRLRET